MHYIKYLFIHLEVAGFFNRIHHFVRNNPSPFLSILLGMTLLYTIYFVFTIHYWAGIPTDFTRVLFVGICISSMLIYFSRNKLTEKPYQFLYMNSRIRGSHLIHASMLIYFIFYGIAMILIIAPFLTIKIQFDGYFDFNFILNITFWSIFVFYFIYCLWMTVQLLVSKFVSRTKDYLILKSIIFIFGMLALMLGIHFYEPSSKNSWYFILIVLCLLCTNFWYIGCISHKYFRALNLNAYGTAKNRKRSRMKGNENSPIRQGKLEYLHLFRNGIFTEQFMVFIFVIAMCYLLFVYMDNMEFLFLYQYIANFGLMEVFIFISLEVGILYRMKRIFIYSLNEKKHDYIIYRLLFLYVMNITIYMLFTLFTFKLVGTQLNFDFNIMYYLLLVTILSYFIGFSLQITAGNKIIVLLVLLVGVNIYDILLNTWIHHMGIINYIHVLLGFVLYLLLVTYFVKRPILR